MVKIKILIADDHKLFRTGLVKMLEGYSDILIIGEAEDGQELCDKYLKLRPDVVLTDISMPLSSGTEAAKKIIESDKTAKILFLSMYYSEEYIYTGIISGGSGLVNKNIMEEELVEAIRKVYSGERYFGKSFTEEMLAELLLKYDSIYIKNVDMQKPDLSRRELEVLKHIGEGCTSAEISNKLYIDIRTVDTHRSNIMHKLNLKSLSELIKYAIMYNISQEK